MNILLMSNFSNPRYSSVWGFLLERGHLVDTTQDHRKLDLTKYDIGVAFYYRKMVSQADLDTIQYGVINNHPGKLPEVRGAFTNVWPVMDSRIPCGVTIQLMDAGLDTGPIIAENTVEVSPTDTGETLWYRLVEEQYHLFCRTWPRIEQEVPDITTYKQYGRPWTYKMADVIDDLDKWQNGGAILNYLRARTFPPFDSAYVVRNGRKIGVRVQLEDLGPA